MSQTRSKLIRFGLAALLVGAVSCQQQHADPSGGNARKTPMPIQQTEFGTSPDGKSIQAYTISNANGVTAKVITWGARLTELHVPDAKGNSADIVLGFDQMKGPNGYLSTENPYFGATVGRYANRIANAHFTLDGQEYKLAANNGPNTLHGGKRGFDQVIWKAEPIQNGPDGQAVKFSYLSPDGEEGFPGNLNVTVTYTLTDKNELVLDYKATTDKDTVLCLTNHSYFNLSGAGNGTINDEVLQLNCDKYLPVNDQLIPTGQILDVKGTPFDFSRPTPIGERFDQVGGTPVGYDHCYVINGAAGTLRQTARVTDPKSGRILEMATTEPAVQFYTGNFLNGAMVGPNGKPYLQHGAFCLEAEHYPDSPNQPNFPSVELKPGQTYSQTTVYRFPRQ